MLVSYDSASESASPSSGHPSPAAHPTPAHPYIPQPSPLGEPQELDEQPVASGSRAPLPVVAKPASVEATQGTDDDMGGGMAGEVKMAVGRKRSGHTREPTQAERNENRWKFQAELEFVQGLANPAYLYELAWGGMFEDDAFLNYLEYLEYWREPEYAVFLTYPSCLRYLTLLKSPRFREAVRYKENFIAELFAQGDIIWRTWRESDDTRLRREQYESSLLAAAAASAAAEAQPPTPVTEPVSETVSLADTEEQERPTKKMKGKARSGGSTPRSGMSPRVGGGMSPIRGGGGMSPREGKRAKV